MKKFIFGLLFSIILFSCSNNKKNNEQLLLLIKENSVLMNKQSLEMKKSQKYLTEQNSYIYDMAAAGATPKEIKKLETEKENNLNTIEKRIKDIEYKMINNNPLGVIKLFVF